MGRGSKTVEFGIRASFLSQPNSCYKTKKSSPNEGTNQNMDLLKRKTHGLVKLPIQTFWSLYSKIPLMAEIHVFLCPILCVYPESDSLHLGDSSTSILCADKKIWYPKGVYSTMLL